MCCRPPVTAVGLNVNALCFNPTLGRHAPQAAAVAGLDANASCFTPSSWDLAFSLGESLSLPQAGHTSSAPQGVHSGAHALYPTHFPTTQAVGGCDDLGRSGQASAALGGALSRVQASIIAHSPWGLARGRGLPFLLSPSTRVAKLVTPAQPPRGNILELRLLLSHPSPPHRLWG